jgi:hypothetical protein
VYSFCVGVYVISVPGYNVDWLVFMLLVNYVMSGDRG